MTPFAALRYSARTSYKSHHANCFYSFTSDKIFRFQKVKSQLFSVSSDPHIPHIPPWKHWYTRIREKRLFAAFLHNTEEVSASNVGFLREKVLPSVDDIKNSNICCWTLFFGLGSCRWPCEKKHGKSNSSLKLLCYPRHLSFFFTIHIDPETYRSSSCDHLIASMRKWRDIQLHAKQLRLVLPRNMY